MVAGPQETTERKRPARCCAAGVRGLGCRGCQHGRGGTLPVCFRSQSRSVHSSSALLPLSPRGAATAGAPTRRGSRWRFAAACGERRAGFAAKPHLAKGRSPCLEGAAERRRGMVRRRALRTAIRPAQGPRVTRRCRLRSPGAPDGKKRGSARRALPLVCFQRQTG